MNKEHIAKVNTTTNDRCEHNRMEYDIVYRGERCLDCGCVSHVHTDLYIYEHGVCGSREDDPEVKAIVRRYLEKRHIAFEKIQTMVNKNE